MADALEAVSFEVIRYLLSIFLAASYLTVWLKDQIIFCCLFNYYTENVFRYLLFVSLTIFFLLSFLFVISLDYYIIELFSLYLRFLYEFIYLDIILFL